MAENDNPIAATEAPRRYLRIVEPPTATGERGVCTTASLNRLRDMPEFQAGARSVRNQALVEESRELGRGQRRPVSGMQAGSAAPAWWDL